MSMDILKAAMRFKVNNAEKLPNTLRELDNTSKYVFAVSGILVAIRMLFNMYLSFKEGGSGNTTTNNFKPRR